MRKYWHFLPDIGNKARMSILTIFIQHYAEGPGIVIRKEKWNKKIGEEEMKPSIWQMSCWFI